jgi:hypothetical protein
LAVTAGTYVPVDSTRSNLQSQAAYREPARLIQPGPPKAFPPTAASILPTPVVQVQQQTWIHAQNETWRLQPEPAGFAGIAASYLGPAKLPQNQSVAWPYSSSTQPVLEPIAATVPVAGQVPYSVLPNVVQQAWVYAALETWRLQPDPANLGGITQVYVGAPAVLQIGQQAWPYVAMQARQPLPILATPGQVPYSAPSILAQALWSYAQQETWRLSAEPAPFAGITAVYVGPAAVPIVAAAQWPYWSAFFAAGPASTQQPAAAIYTYAPTIQPVRQPDWAYAATMLRPAPSTAGITPIYLGAPPVSQFESAPWPYASMQLEAATPIAPASTVPQRAFVQAPAQASWPYTLAAAIGKILGGQPAPAFFGFSPVRQWLTQSPWPYSVTMPVIGVVAAVPDRWKMFGDRWVVDPRSAAWLVQTRSQVALVDARPNLFTPAPR